MFSLDITRKSTAHSFELNIRTPFILDEAKENKLILFNLFTIHFCFFALREVIQKEKYGKKSDCWSFGCIMYAMVTGQPPFESGNIQDTLKQAMKANLVFPDNISNDLRDLIGRLVNRNVDYRLSIEEILEHRFFTSHTRPQITRKQSQLFISDQYPKAPQQLWEELNTPSQRFNIYSQLQQDTCKTPEVHKHQQHPHQYLYVSNKSQTHARELFSGRQTSTHRQSVSPGPQPASLFQGLSRSGYNTRCLADRPAQPGQPQRCPEAGRHPTGLPSSANQRSAKSSYGQKLGVPTEKVPVFDLNR